MKNKIFKNGRKQSLFSSKRAIVDDMLFWIFRIILIMVVTFSLVFFVNSVIKKNLESEKLELNLIAARVINSNDCLAMSEDIGVYAGENVVRMYPGKIRLSSYDEEKLKNNCIITEGNARVGVNITIYGLPSKYINKEYYEDIEPLTFSSKYQKVRKVLPVLVYNADGKVESKTIEVVAVAKKR